MTKKEMKQSLQKAVLSSTPNVLEKVLEVQDDSAVIEFKEAIVLKQNRPLRMAACMVAAVFMLCVGLVYFTQPKVDSLVSIDVNPGIELSIDAADRVLDCKALNSDAVKVLDGMDLKQKPLDVATDAIVHSLVQNGYLQANSEDNAILLSVANNNTERTKVLQKKLAVSVNTVLKQNNAQAVVLQQSDSLTKDLNSFAKEKQISVGKADFIRKIVGKDAQMQTEDLTDLSIRELALLVNENRIDLSDSVIMYEDDAEAKTEEILSKIDEAIDKQTDSENLRLDDGAENHDSKDSKPLSPSDSSKDVSSKPALGDKKDKDVDINFPSLPQKPPIDLEPLPPLNEEEPVSSEIDREDPLPNDGDLPIKDSGSSPLPQSSASESTESLPSNSDGTLVDSALNSSSTLIDVCTCPNHSGLQGLEENGTYCQQLCAFCRKQHSLNEGKQCCKHCSKSGETNLPGINQKDDSSATGFKQGNGSHEAAKN